MKGTFGYLYFGLFLHLKLRYLLLVYIMIIFQAEVVPGSLFETYLKLTFAAVKKSLESLRDKPDRNRWVATATTVNAFYSATLNSVSKYTSCLRRLMVFFALPRRA